jgi:hypothetical protein
VGSTDYQLLGSYLEDRVLVMQIVFFFFKTQQALKLVGLVKIFTRVIKLLLSVFRAMLLVSSLIESVPLMKKIPKGTNFKKKKKRLSKGTFVSITLLIPILEGFCIFRLIFD